MLSVSPLQSLNSSHQQAYRYRTDDSTKDNCQYHHEIDCPTTAFLSGGSVQRGKGPFAFCNSCDEKSISPLAIIAVPIIEAGYSEHDDAIKAVASGAVGTTELSGCKETPCRNLSMDCVGLRSDSEVRASGASGMAFGPVSSAVLPDSELKAFSHLN